MSTDTDIERRGRSTIALYTLTNLRASDLAMLDSDDLRRLSHHFAVLDMEIFMLLTKREGGPRLVATIPAPAGNVVQLRRPGA